MIGRGKRGIFVAVLPHPGPLPLGEGATSTALVPSGRSTLARGGLRSSLSKRERAGVRESAGFVSIVILFATAFSSLAASVGALVDDRLAVERVYYAKQKDAKQPFEQAVPRSVIERRVQQELLKERVLQRVYAVTVGADQVQAEVERIRRSSMNPQMLREIQEALAGSPARFADTVAKPLVVDRVLRARFEADAAPQNARRQEADALRAKLLAAKPADRAALLAGREDTREITWKLGAKPKADVASARPVAPGSRDSYFAELPAEMQRVLAAQLQQPGDVSAVFGADSHFAISVATSRTPETLTVQAVELPHLTFDDWLTAQARTNP